ncbi:MAG: aldehyde-activating protein [Haliea sp.]|uniref:GFA family protein n=1 Tax=Haliea sp. TaxID=1932666 RepID=UPI000C5C9EA5|nr:GFA family protein [Haliea sp.]MBM68094.1 aldehyde-activating protein [Haliea sp.]|tara:strand:- start:4769 stop:5188 length:420 start_codon:yes stop_codon:yes gene_type:complete
MSLRTASCACSQLKLSISGEPEIVAICSCEQCQRRTGSVYSAHAFFPRDGVTIKGDHRTFTRDSDSGKKVTFHFCPHCASSVFWEAEKRPTALGIALGALSGPELPLPIAALYVQKKLDWVPLPEGMPVFEQGVPAKPE